MKKVLKCNDCEKAAEIEGKEVKNGSLLKYKDGKNVIVIFKCAECLEKSKVLKNFRDTEVYSRVVGYIRPVKQFNVGKKQEYEDRKEYVINYK
jgi:hypothetical protein